MQVDSRRYAFIFLSLLLLFLSHSVYAESDSDVNVGMGLRAEARLVMAWIWVVGLNDHLAVRVAYNSFSITIAPLTTPMQLTMAQ